MNLELVAHILRKGKALAPDRFPAIPANPEDAKLTLDAWAEALGTLDFPPALWAEAVTRWATQLAGERMATPKDILHAAMLVRNDWEGDAEKGAILRELRVARANRTYEKAGLDPITEADLPQYAGKPPEAITDRHVTRESAPQRLGDITPPKFKRRSEA